AELAQIYGVEVLVIPTNQPVNRADQPDLIYKTEDAKFDAVVEDVVQRHEAGQPILLGTVSIEKSERLARLLTKRGVRHEVLNAKLHAREAEIIAQAGRPGAVTVATNMAGRGVDIMLGGNPEGMAKVELKRQGVALDSPDYEAKLAELTRKYAGEIVPDKERVKAAGGLYVVGTERHESRRIDNQLRGRSGRQGDEGESRFYLSLGDDLMRRFQGERVSGLMDRMRIPDDVPIEAGMVTKAIERAQRTVESQNFEIRKNVLKYDEVMNRQREVIYEWRENLLDATGDDLIGEWIDKVIGDTVESVLAEEMSPSEWDWELLNKELGQFYKANLNRDDFDRLNVEEVVEIAVEQARAAYTERERELTPEVLRQYERQIALFVIDNKWREHLSEMDYLRSGIGLRAMGQRDPLVEYQREGFMLFSELVDAVKRDSIKHLFHVQAPEAAAPVRRPEVPGPVGRAQPAVSKGDVGRNDPCPCGSGKKYKRCHGAA
ncbi:MAG: SEC-C metal-binding domain-containing protein, partial [Acidimicrobiia bacterium]